MKIKSILIVLVMLFVILMIPYKVNAVRIVLDAGHGGHDTGAINSSKNINEKTINLKIAKYLKDYLEQYQNTEIILTRSDDTFLEIYDRSMIARNKKADLMVSLHLNSVASGTANGAEVYVTHNTSLDKYNKETTILGNKILNNLNKLGIKNRGVKTRLITNDNTDIYTDGSIADYYGIIRYAMRGCRIDSGVVKPAGAVPAKVEKGEGIPAMIIEHCYINNNTDYAYIDSEEDIKKLAKADADAIADYYQLTEKPSSKFEIKENFLVAVPEITLKEIQEKQPTATLVNTTSGMVPGAKIKIEGKEYTVVILGDVNGDGQSSAGDYVLIKNHIMDTKKLTDPSKIEAANVNRDDNISAGDYVLIKNYIMKGTKFKL